jgi:metallo-beta-lactamase class B
VRRGYLRRRGLLPLLALALSAPVDGAVYHAEIAPLAPDRPGLYLVHSYGTWQGQKIEANGLLVASQGCVAMIDTAWGTLQTQEVLAWVKKELKAPVKFAVITHAHADRIGGIGVLRAAHIPTYGDELTPAEARRHGFPSPDHQFRKQIALSCGELTLDLFYPGPGHTRDNLTVYVRGSRVLYGGCFLKSAASTSLGNLEDADLKAWPKSLEALEQRFPDAEIVIPGHGGIDPGAIARTRKLLQEAPAKP